MPFYTAGRYGKLRSNLSITESLKNEQKNFFASWSKAHIREYCLLTDCIRTGRQGFHGGVVGHPFTNFCQMLIKRTDFYIKAVAYFF